MVRELFEMARTKKACLIFFDEIDAIGGKTGTQTTATIPGPLGASVRVEQPGPDGSDSVCVPPQGPGLMMAPAVTMRCSAPCWSSSTSWMASIPGGTSRS